MEMGREMPEETIEQMLGRSGRKASSTRSTKGTDHTLAPSVMANSSAIQNCLESGHDPAIKRFRPDQKLREDFIGAFNARRRPFPFREVPAKPRPNTVFRHHPASTTSGGDYQRHRVGHAYDFTPGTGSSLLRQTEHMLIVELASVGTYNRNHAMLPPHRRHVPNIWDRVFGDRIHHTFTLYWSASPFMPEATSTGYSFQLFTTGSHQFGSYCANMSVRKPTHSVVTSA